MTSIKASICIATYRRPEILAKTLASIAKQRPPFEYEVIVVEDDSPVYRNPSIARNKAYAQARGEVIICQSDDVLHHSPNCIEELVVQLIPDTFVIATVYNVDEEGKLKLDNYRLTTYTSPHKQRPLFFLGSLFRKDLLVVGGNDEDFIYPGREDFWFADCLQNGARLVPYYSSTIVGHHQHHSRNIPHRQFSESQATYKDKMSRALKGEIPWKAERSLLNKKASQSC